MRLADIKSWLDEVDNEPEPTWDDLKFDPLVLLNTLVYFAAALQLGAGFWKSLIIAIIVAILTRLHYGHRALARLGVLLLVLTLGLWAEILPPPQQWQPLIVALTGRSA